MSGEHSVYQPAEDTWLLIDCVSQTQLSGLVVEVGSGSGEVSRFLAEKGAEVVAIDISYAAAEATRSRCGPFLSRVHVVLGDKLSALRPSERITLIVSNPPYLPSEGITDRAIYSAPTGAEFIKDLIEESTPFLEKKAKLLTIASTLSSPEAITEYAADKALQVTRKSSRRLFFEEITCYELSKATE
ncbi:MAG: methyltransferase [Nitrososphaerota archaeon]